MDENDQTQNAGLHPSVDAVRADRTIETRDMIVTARVAAGTLGYRSQDPRNLFTRIQPSGNDTRVDEKIAAVRAAGIDPLKFGDAKHAVEVAHALDNAFGPPSPAEVADQAVGRLEELRADNPLTLDHGETVALRDFVQTHQRDLEPARQAVAHRMLSEMHGHPPQQNFAERMQAIVDAQNEMPASTITARVQSTSVHEDAPTNSEHLRGPRL